MQINTGELSSSVVFVNKNGFDCGIQTALTSQSAVPIAFPDRGPYRPQATINMLRIAEPYIAYGYPSLASVRQLLYKRGFVKVNNQRLPITSNELIESKVGNRGIICVEDIVHEVFTVGPNFRKVTNFLWPFKVWNGRNGFNW